jgi:hypothetical protein
MSLTTVSVAARKTIRYGIYSIIGLIILRIVLGFAIDIYKRTFPKPPPPPTVGFQKLPPLSWKNIDSLPKLEYKLETANGSLPGYPGQMKVYKFTKDNVGFLTTEETIQRANNIGFTEKPEEITPTLLKFKSTKTPSILEINSVTGVFSITYNISADPDQVTQTPPPPTSSAASVRGFLNQVMPLPEDLSEGTTKTEFYSIESDQLKKVVSYSEAKIIKVNIFRQDQEVTVGTEKVKLPTVTPKVSESNVWFYVGGKGTPFAGEYKYYPIDSEKFETYPIKNAQQAFNDLIAGKGYIAQLGENTDGKVTIRRAYLGYYDPGNLDDKYFEPVFVFEGDRGFTAYIPAVTDQYYGTTQ